MSDDPQLVPREIENMEKQNVYLAFLVIILGLLFVVRSSRKSNVRNVPILLRDQIPSARKRMAEYSTRGRALLEQGHKMVI